MLAMLPFNVANCRYDFPTRRMRLGSGPRPVAAPNADLIITTESVNAFYKAWSVQVRRWGPGSALCVRH